MCTHNICLYKEVDIKYTGCYLKHTKLLVCVLIGVCAVIRPNTVYIFGAFLDKQYIYVYVIAMLVQKFEKVYFSTC